MGMNSSKKTDDALYAAFLQGDSASYDQLMIRHGDSLTFYLHGITHDWHDAEDMMIEAFARIMAKRPRIGEGAFKAYIYKTGRNLAIRHATRMRNRRSFSLDDLNTEPAAEEYLEERVTDDERKKILHLCLDRIEPELKETMWLIYFEEMTYAQAAEVMKVNTRKIDYSLAKAKKIMREELRKEGIHSAYQ